MTTQTENEKPTRKPGRPRKYNTKAEQLQAQAACMQRLRDERGNANKAAALAAYEKRWGTEFVPFSFPPRYKDGRGEISAEDLLKGMAKVI